MKVNLNISMRLLLTASLAATLAACTGTSANPPNSGPPTGNETVLKVQNLDGLPFADRLVFNRIRFPSYGNDPARTLAMKDQGTVRVLNTGTQELRITGVTFNGPWQLADSTTVPAILAAGKSVDLNIRFTANGERSGTASCSDYTDDRTNAQRVKCLYQGSMTINTSDADESRKLVQLAGYWQEVPERNNEPTLQQILDVFGYKTNIDESRLDDNGKGTVRRIGDEVLSPYWRRADPGKPVSVRWLAAFHGVDNDGGLQYNHVYWYPKGSVTKASDARRIATQDKVDAQSMLPRTTALTGPAAATFTPATGEDVFGFRVQDEWSDPKLNTDPNLHTISGDCSGDGGHLVRFFTLKDRSGAPIKDTYLMVMDAYCVNYDYNDNVLIVSNIKPETTP